MFFTWYEEGKLGQRVHNGEDIIEIVVGVMSMKSLYKVSLATCGLEGRTKYSGPGPCLVLTGGKPHKSQKGTLTCPITLDG